MNDLKSITLIPARGGSKGIPGKSIVDVAGKPLLAYSIDASLDSGVTETWVSTDDDRIAEIARGYGANVINRPDEISTDDATSESALLHFVNEIEEFDILVFLQATCPFVKKEDINKAIRLIGEYDSVISVSKFDQFLWVGSEAMYDINNRKRRQNREQMYVETGSIFVTTRKRLIQNNNRISGKVGFVEVPKWRSIDIDTYDDLELVRKIMRGNNEGAK